MRTLFLVLAAFLRKGHVAFHSHYGGSVRAWLAPLALASVLSLAPVAGATTLTLALDVEYSDGQTPAGTPPFITATFDDSVVPDHVQLTLSASNLVGREIVGRWLFNFDPAMDPTQLTFTPVSNAASVPNSIDTGIDAFMAAGGGLFDISFDFPPPPGHDSDAFSAGETLIYDISYVGPINASSFDVLSAPGGGNGTHASAAHIMRIGTQADGSGWIGATTVPEPSTALLLGAGLVGLATVGRRSR